MIITVHVKTGASTDKLIFNSKDGIYEAFVKARPIEGEANKAVISLLAAQLGIPKSTIRLKSGTKSRLKRFEY